MMNDEIWTGDWMWQRGPGPGNTLGPLVELVPGAGVMNRYQMFMEIRRLLAENERLQHRLHVMLGEVEASERFAGQLESNIRFLNEALALRSAGLDAMRQARDFHGANSAERMKQVEQLEYNLNDAECRYAACYVELTMLQEELAECKGYAQNGNSKPQERAQ